MKQNHKRRLIIKVDEVDFYNIHYDLKSLLRRVNANGYDVEEIANKLEEIRKSAQLEDEQEVKTVEEINKAISELKEISIKAISDGWHTFDELYYHRMILTLVICRQNRDTAFKSKLHNDGTMFDGQFIVGLITPKGQYTYHYDLKYWDLFDVTELDRFFEYDGHKPSDIGRLLSLCENNEED